MVTCTQEIQTGYGERQGPVLGPFLDARELMETVTGTSILMVKFIKVIKIVAI